MTKNIVQILTPRNGYNLMQVSEQGHVFLRTNHPENVVSTLQAYFLVLLACKENRALEQRMPKCQRVIPEGSTSADA